MTLFIWSKYSKNCNTLSEKKSHHCGCTFSKGKTFVHFRCE